MWRLWTPIEQFPAGFDHCEVALQAQIYEASHTYRIKGTNKFLTIIEENGRRYYKAYLADRLDGPLGDQLLTVRISRSPAGRICDPQTAWNLGPTTSVTAN